MSAAEVLLLCQALHWLNLARRGHEPWESCMLYLRAGRLIQCSYNIHVLRLFLISSNGQKAISEHLHVLPHTTKLLSCSIIKTKKITKLLPSGASFRSFGARVFSDFFHPVGSISDGLDLCDSQWRWPADANASAGQSGLESPNGKI